MMFPNPPKPYRPPTLKDRPVPPPIAQWLEEQAELGPLYPWQRSMLELYSLQQSPALLHRSGHRSFPQIPMVASPHLPKGKLVVLGPPEAPTMVLLGMGARSPERRSAATLWGYLRRTLRRILSR